MNSHLEIPAWAGPATAGPVTADHVTPDAVAASRGDARYCVDAADWYDLPAEIVELLAPPVVVSAREIEPGRPVPEPGQPDEPAPAATRSPWYRRRF